MKNLSRSALISKALRMGHNDVTLTNQGALVVNTAPYTGRSPDAKFIVKDDITSSLVDWNHNQAMSEEEFDNYYQDFMKAADIRLFYEQEVYAGSDPGHRLAVKINTTKPWHSLFAKNMFFEPTTEELSDFKPEFQVFSFPRFSNEPKVIISFKSPNETASLYFCFVVTNVISI